jgi:WD40 repeat protein
MNRTTCVPVSLLATLLGLAPLAGAAAGPQEAPEPPGAGRPGGPPERLTLLAQSRDGKTALGRQGKGPLRLWDTATSKPRGEALEHDEHEGLLAATFSPDGRTVITAGWDQTARRWDAATGKPLGAPLRHEGPVNAVTVSPDGKLLLTGSGNWALGNEHRLWDLATGRLWQRHGHASAVMAVAFSPDGKTFATAHYDGTLRLWETATTKLRAGPWRGRTAFFAVAFSPDGRTALVAGRDQTAQRWDLATGKPVGPPLRHRGDVWAAAFSCDGRLILTGSDDRTARLWDAATGKPLGPPLRHATRVNFVAFSPDGKTVLTGSPGDKRGPGQTLRWPIPGPPRRDPMWGTSVRLPGR